MINIFITIINNVIIVRNELLTITTKNVNLFKLKDVFIMLLFIFIEKKIKNKKLAILIIQYCKYLKNHIRSLIIVNKNIRKKVLA